MNDRVRNLARITICIALTALAIHNCVPRAAGQSDLEPIPESDFQLWPEVQVAIGLSPGSEITASAIVRYGDNVQRSILQRGQAGFNFRPRRFLQITQGYAYLASHPAPGLDIRENRFMLEATLYWVMPRLTLSSRNRFERRFLPNLAYNRYRNRAQVELPLGANGRGTRIVAADEIQYDGALDAWSRNRVTAGLGASLSRRYAIDMYYIYQRDSRIRPSIIHGIGMTLRARFRR